MANPELLGTVIAPQGEVNGVQDSRSDRECSPKTVASTAPSLTTLPWGKPASAKTLSSRGRSTKIKPQISVYLTRDSMFPRMSGWAAGPQTSGVTRPDLYV